MQRIPDDQTPLKIHLPDANAHIAQTSLRLTCANWAAACTDSSDSKQ